MNPSQSGTSQYVWGFYIVRGGINPGDLRFRPRVVGVVEICMFYDPGMRPYPLRVRRDLDVVSRGNPRRALTP